MVWRKSNIWLIIWCCIILLMGVIAWNRTKTSAWFVERNALKLEEENPTEWVFEKSYEEVKVSILECLWNNKYRGFTVSGFGYDFSKKKREEEYYNTQCFCLWNMYQVPSYIYRKGNKGMPVNINMEIYLDSLEPNKTRVQVHVLRYEVQTGYGIRVGTHPFPFPVRGELRRLLPASTIEPYEILYKIAKKLELTREMPEIKYPKELTSKEREQTYFNYNENNKRTWDSWDG